MQVRMGKLKSKVQVSRLQAPIKFGNIWEHSLNGRSKDDVIFLKVYTKQPELYSRGFGIVYILKNLIHKKGNKSSVISTSIVDWVELKIDDFIDRYEIIN